MKDSVDRTEKEKKANKPGNAGPFHKVRKPDRVGNKGRNAKKSFKKHPTAESVRGEEPRGVPFNQRKLDQNVSLALANCGFGSRAYYIFFFWTASAASYFVLKTMAGKQHPHGSRCHWTET